MGNSKPVGLIILRAGGKCWLGNHLTISNAKRPWPVSLELLSAALPVAIQAG